jgi:hypothetical protein
VTYERVDIDALVLEDVEARRGAGDADDASVHEVLALVLLLLDTMQGSRHCCLVLGTAAAATHRRHVSQVAHCTGEVGTAAVSSLSEDLKAVVRHGGDTSIGE